MLKLREMEEELKYAPLPFRNQMMSKIRAYRRDLSMFQREMRSTDLGLGRGNQGDTKYGIFATENEQSVRIRCKLFNIAVIVQKQYRRFIVYSVTILNHLCAFITPCISLYT